MRTCYKCKEDKDLDEFPNNKGKPLGKAYICKECARVSQKGHYSKEQIRFKNRKANWKGKYGLTPKQFYILLEVQNYKCKICREDLEVPCVDHCHDTGRVRGLLCRNCNLGIGYFKDNIELLDYAKDYLR